MKIHNYYPVDLCDGGGTFVSVEIDTNARNENGSCFAVTWSVEGDFSGELTFDTLGAAVAYVALVVEGVSMSKLPPMDARQIEHDFGMYGAKLFGMLGAN